MTEAFYPPRHIAIIMDGNGRWAERRGLPRLMGHKAGGDNIHRVVELFLRHGIKYFTLYTFSTENWKRPTDEVGGIFDILTQIIDSETQYFQQANVRLKHLGRLDRVPTKLRQRIESAIELTRGNTKLTLCICLDYGGRAEIVEAVRRLIADGISPQNLDEALIGQYLYTEGIPDPDLIIRTGGDMRLSNFLLWQAAYSELYFTPTLWPDLDEKELEEALLNYRQRKRRFGGLQP